VWNCDRKLTDICRIGSAEVISKDGWCWFLIRTLGNIAISGVCPGRVDHIVNNSMTSEMFCCCCLPPKWFSQRPLSCWKNRETPSKEFSIFLKWAKGAWLAMVMWCVRGVFDVNVD
jgi:hypothetical protein